MLNILKKNQLVIFAIAFMLVTIGYMSYSMNTEKVAQTSVKEEMEQAGIGDARLVSNNNVIICINHIKYVGILLTLNLIFDIIIADS